MVAIKKAVYTADDLVDLAEATDLEYSQYEWRDYVPSADAPGVLADNPGTIALDLPLDNIMGRLPMPILKRFITLHGVAGLPTKAARGSILAKLTEHVCANCPSFVSILAPYRAQRIVPGTEEVDFQSLADGMKALTPEELQFLGLDVAAYPSFIDGAKVVGTHRTPLEERPNSPADVEACVVAPPLFFASKLSKGALLTFAKCHGMSVSKRWTIATILEQFQLHDCAREGCSLLYWDLAVNIKTRAFDEDEDQDPGTLNWPTDDGERENSVFPPQPIKPKKKAEIIHNFIADCEESLLREAHCAVCAQLYPECDLLQLDRSKYSLIPLIEDEVVALPRRSKDEPREYAQGPILDDNSDYICDECHSCLSRGIRPKFALANSLWLGDVPECLKCLTYTERLLVAKIRHNRSVVRVSSGHSKMVANVVSYANPTPKVYRRLPPHRRELDDVLVFIFVGVQPPTEEDFRRTPMLVRRVKVLQALEWLCLNHEDYWDVDIDYDALKSYNESKAPVEVLYHPITDDEGNVIPTAASVHATDLEDGAEDGPCPYRVHGLTGTGFEAMTTNQRKVQALRFLRQGGSALAIGHENEPESMYRNPGLYPQMFPWLFPTGKGAIGQDNLKGVISETAHKRWLLNYYDRRFQEDPHFIVVAFNHDQIKEGSSKSYVLAKRRNFNAIATKIRDINPLALRDIGMRMEEGGRVVPETDEERRCFALIDSIKNVSVKVNGSLASKQNDRSALWSMTYFMGLPPWYITMAPVDHKHPICIYRCDQTKVFDGEILPSSVRVRMASLNPVACAKFFDFVVRMFIKHVLGWENPEGGRFGKVSGYFGTVEQQGRMTLHLHALVWIAGTLSPLQIRERLLSGDSEFQKQLISYLEDCHIGEFMTGTLEQVAENLDKYQDEKVDYKDPTLSLPKAPPMPLCDEDELCGCVECQRLEQWFEEFKLEVDDLLMRSNLHECIAGKNSNGDKTGVKTHSTAKGCINKDGKCTARFPRETFNTSSVDPKDGHINIKKLESMMNNVTPELTYLLRCNTDVSCLLSGTAMKAVIAYVTDYITKPSLKTYQVFSTSYDVFSRHESLLSPELDHEQSLEAARKLIMKCVNSVTSQIEIGAPMAALYLLGNPDRYCSHEFVPFYWKGFVNLVQKTWSDYEECLDRGDEGEEEPEIELHHITVRGVDGENDLERDEEGLAEEEHEDDDQPKELIAIRRTGTGYIGKSAVDDYRWRPRKFENINLYEWIQCAVRKRIGQYSARRHGESKLRYYRYMEQHPLYDSHVVSADASRRETVIPNFLGHMVPRKDEGDPEDYCCAMLTIFKPWRSPLDLKQAGATWMEAFRNHNFSSRELRLISNLNLRYECYDEKDDYALQMKNQLPVSADFIQEVADGEDGLEDMGDIYGVDEAIAARAFLEDDLHGADTTAFDAARQTLVNAGWKPTEDECRSGRAPDVAIGDFQVDKLLTTDGWKKLVATQRKKILDSKFGGLSTAFNKGSTSRDTTELESAWHSIKKGSRVFIAPGSYLTKVFKEYNLNLMADNVEGVEAVKSKYNFNYEQQKAFEIVSNHAMGDNSEQLKMYIGGMGGTGKSQVLKGIIDFFKARGEEYRFVVLAPTGNAASLIDGSTYHSYLKIYPGQKESDIPSKVDELRTQLETVDYIFIDEVSMMSCHDMYNVSRRLCDARNRPDLPFGGLNIIFAGDFAQLPPVNGYSLYSRKVSEYQSPRQTLTEQNNSIGKRAWLQITTVVILKQNMRQASNSPNDVKFRRALQNLRYYNCDAEDIAFLRSRVPANNPSIDMNSHNLKFAAVITALNIDKDGYNSLYSKRFARERNATLHNFYSIDKPASTSPASGGFRRRGRRIRLTYVDQDIQQKLWSLPPSTSKLIPGKLTLCLGMPVCIRYNIATELCITKGQEGTVVGWTASSHPRAPALQILEVLFVKLTNPPKAINLPYLPENVVPITKTSTTIRAQWGTKKTEFSTISRTQMPILPLFSMTDYASQGKSRPYNVVDFSLCRSFQAVYVCLSRGTTAEGTVILEDFDESAVRGTMDKDLAMEYRALKHLDEVTDLVYQSELPTGILHTNRKDTLAAYREWKGISEAEGDLREGGYTHEGKRKGSDVDNGVLANDGPPVKRQKVALGGRSTVKGGNSAMKPIGAKWDPKDPSCAYDCVVAILYDLWTTRGGNWEVLTGGVSMLQRLGSAFTTLLHSFYPIVTDRPRELNIVINDT